ncbi:Branched-chain amino acid ABC-type transport system, permease components [hydrothermal vent metagenome]|uniref:Branched-chain amino acid ABC-type transport system, permease components n=1 Tax=hydrothermal vent metagenome TaxID=652676 RepID=A0A1W1E6A4_9ZZZZ
MYTEEDLNNAVKQDIFNQSAVDNFRQWTASNNNTNHIDEENFKLISSFNDIFVVIACLLLLFSAGWWLNSMQDNSGYIAFPIIAWGLSEIFIRNKKMSLPAIVLLIAFIGGIFSLSTNLLSFSIADNLTIAASLSTLGAYLHWLRFKVPITVAVGSVSLIGFLIALILSTFPATENYLPPILLTFGVITFGWAMFWDYADIDRVTHKSDIAFWLHLVSAPLIIHPIFEMLGLLDGNAGIGVLISVIALYVFMSLLSIAIDRRAFIVSSLAYVLYAISSILKTYGDIDYNFALTGVLIGTTLLLLSAYWHQTRKIILSLLPSSIKQYLAR